MDERMTLPRLLEAIRSERAAWEAALARVPIERMDSPSLPGGWSVKDMLAHIVWFEREMIGMLQGRTLAGGSDLWLKPQDERNRLIYEANKARTFENVQAEAGRIYPRLLELIEGLSDDELNDPARFQEMPADWVPWEILAGSTSEHYRDHANELETWLNG